MAIENQIAKLGLTETSMEVDGVFFHSHKIQTHLFQVLLSFPGGHMKSGSIPPFLREEWTD